MAMMRARAVADSSRRSQMMEGCERRERASKLPLQNWGPRIRSMKFHQESLPSAARRRNKSSKTSFLSS